ncbi:hypothetical protein RHMOL_Rhmol04G0127000 [Rhododendron molle]|uniref:Uncharacterized protein n=1 Tax=Rhododendron molle TaxID=49168 RepID=A0ACC0P0Z6_RHOML|nr:hypothetical protein RHMOL_Rhmol04G0127000 [Rhododendron molle]
MANRLTPIKNINRNAKNWTAKVKVLGKWSPRSAQCSPVKYQKLLLADAECAGCSIVSCSFSLCSKKTGAVFGRYFAGYRFWQGKPVRHLEGKKMDSLHSNIRDWKARGRGLFYCRTKLDIELEGDRGDCDEAGAADSLIWLATKPNDTFPNPVKSMSDSSRNVEYKRYLMRQLGVEKIDHVYCEGNKCANLLANMNFNDGLDFHIFDVALDCIISHLCDDRNGVEYPRLLYTSARIFGSKDDTQIYGGKVFEGCWSKEDPLWFYIHIILQIPGHLIGKREVQLSSTLASSPSAFTIPLPHGESKSLFSASDYFSYPKS